MPRRRYLHEKARMAYNAGDLATAGAFEAKRQAAPGTPLPTPFINARVRLALVTAPIPFDAYEDLEDASIGELASVDGISRHDAALIQAAVATFLAANPTASLAFTRPQNAAALAVI